MRGAEAVAGAKEGNDGLFGPMFPEHWLPSPLYAMAMRPAPKTRSCKS